MEKDSKFTLSRCGEEREPEGERKGKYERYQAKSKEILDRYNGKIACWDTMHF